MDTTVLKPSAWLQRYKYEQHAQQLQMSKYQAGGWLAQASKEAEPGTEPVYTEIKAAGTAVWTTGTKEGRTYSEARWANARSAERGRKSPSHASRMWKKEPS